MTPMKKKLKNKENHKRIDGVVTLVASLLVLFTSMFDPRLSLIFAFVFLVLYSIFKIFFDKR